MNSAPTLQISREPGRRLSSSLAPSQPLTIQRTCALGLWFLQKPEGRTWSASCHSLWPELLSPIRSHHLLLHCRSHITLTAASTSGCQSHQHLSWAEPSSPRVQGLSRLWFRNEGWWRCWARSDEFDLPGTLLGLNNARENCPLGPILLFPGPLFFPQLLNIHPQAPNYRVDTTDPSMLSPLMLHLCALRVTASEWQE